MGKIKRLVVRRVGESKVMVCASCGYETSDFEEVMRGGHYYGSFGDKWECERCSKYLIEFMRSQCPICSGNCSEH